MSYALAVEYLRAIDAGRSAGTFLPDDLFEFVVELTLVALDSARVAALLLDTNVDSVLVRIRDADIRKGR